MSDKKLDPEVERMQREADAGKAFHDLAVKERNAAWEESRALRAEVKRLMEERDEIHDAIGIVGVDEPMTTLDAAQRLKAERDSLRADLSAAAGDLPVPVPVPGTDMARLLSANVLLRKERDEACEGESARAVERDAARKERDDLRLRGYAELSALAEDVLRMTQECYPSTASPRDREILHRHGEAMATKILRNAMEARDSWPRSGVVGGMTRLFPTHAELDEARKERDSLRALLKAAREGGRREGIEEAAKVCESRRDSHSSYSDKNEADKCARAIRLRALAAKEVSK